MGRRLKDVDLFLLRSTMRMDSCEPTTQIWKINHHMTLTRQLNTPQDFSHNITATTIKGSG